MSEKAEYEHYMAMPKELAIATLIDARIRETGGLEDRAEKAEAKVEKAFKAGFEFGRWFVDEEQYMTSDTISDAYTAWEQGK